jgi:hypothetical protein
MNHYQLKLLAQECAKADVHFKVQNIERTNLVIVHIFKSPDKPAFGIAFQFDWKNTAYEDLSRWVINAIHQLNILERLNNQSQDPNICHMFNIEKSCDGCYFTDCCSQYKKKTDLALHELCPFKKKTFDENTHNEETLTFTQRHVEEFCECVKQHCPNYGNWVFSGKLVYCLACIPHEHINEITSVNNSVSIDNCKFC